MNMHHGAARLPAVLRLCHDLAHATTLAGMFTSVVDALVAGTGVTRASVLTFDEFGVMRFRASHGLSEEYMRAVDGHSPWTADVVDPQAILVDDTATHPATAGLLHVLAREHIGALAFLPLCGDGRLLGKFMLYREEPTTWQDVDLEFARAAADLLASFLLRERALERLVQARKMESLGLLAGGIAHDFNNMITSMLGYIDLIRVETLRDTPARTYVEGLRSTTEQAADLTRQLLGFARPAAGARDDVDLGPFLDDVVPALQNLCGSRHQIRLEVSGTPGRVVGGRTQWHQLLTNLVMNARDAMPDGGPILIAVRPGRGDRLVEMTVADKGTGMDEATRRRIFEPLFTTKTLGRGTGLGLATCYAIVTNLGGDIAVRTAPGVGSEFVIEVPRAAGAPVAVPGTGKGLERGAVVLVVEDQEFVLRPLVRSLEVAGYAVLTATNGRQALDVLGDHSVDIVVTDVIMPEMDGAALVAAVQHRWPGVPMLLMTGYVEAARELPPGIPVIIKPFKPRELCYQIDQLLAGAPTPAARGAGRIAH